MSGEKIVVLASATVVALGAYYFLFSSKKKEKKNNTTKTKALVSSPSVCVDPVATSKDALKKAIESLNEQYPNLLKRKFFNSRMFNPVAVRFLQLIGIFL